LKICFQEKQIFGAQSNALTSEFHAGSLNCF